MLTDDEILTVASQIKGRTIIALDIEFNRALCRAQQEATRQEMVKCFSQVSQEVRVIKRAARGGRRFLREDEAQLLAEATLNCI